MTHRDSLIHAENKPIVQTPDRSEQFAFRVLQQVTGHRVSHTDDGSEPRQVDGTWRDEEGRVHAVEVTRRMTEHAGHLLSELSKRDMKVSTPSLEWMWDVRVRPRVSVPEVQEHLEGMLRACENAGVRSLERGSSQFEDHPLAEYILNGSLDADNLDVPNEGYVWLLPQGHGGVSPGMNAVREWVSEALFQQPLADKVAKLVQWQADRRHLFVLLHSSALPFGVIDAFWDEESVPTDPPDVPAEIDRIWLVSKWNHPALSWIRTEGWRRHTLND